MLRRLLSSLILLLVPTALTLSAQDYIFNTFTTSDGFPSKVTSIYVQPKGFAWVGSDEGLVRIDNNTFKIYSHTGEEGSLPGTYVYNVLPDSDGRIWVLTDKGMARYDRESDSFIAPKIVIDGEEREVRAYSMLDIGDSFVVGGDNVIYSLDNSGDNLTILTELVPGQDFAVNTIFPLRDGHYLLHSKESGVLLMEPGTGSIHPLPFDLERQQSALLVDSNGDIWSSSYNRGLLRLSPDGSVKGTYNTDNGLLGSDIVLCLVENGNEIWAGTDGGGIVIIDKTSGEVLKTLSHEGDDPTYIPSETILSLFCAPDGTVWAGRNKGGLIIIKKSFIHSYLSGAAQYRSKSEGITSLLESKDGETIWVGTEGSGLLKFITSTGRFKFYPQTQGLKIFDLEAYEGDKLMVSTIAEGLFIFDPETEKMEPFTTPGGVLEEYALYNNIGVSLCRDDSGRILLMSDNIYRHTPGVERMEIFRLPPRTEPGELQLVFGMWKNRYFHTKTSLYVWDMAADLLEFVLNLGENTVINSAAIGREGEIWIATEDGVGCYSAAENSYTPVESFFLKGARSIIYDAKGRVWVGTRQGMYIYYPIDGSVVALGKTDGVGQNEYSPRARLRTGGNDIYFGGVNGLVRIDQTLNIDLSGVPEISLADAYLDSRRIDDKSKIKLGQDYKSLAVDIFASEDNILREKTYRFRVKGPRVDDTFTSPTPSTNISYHNPGRYRVYASCTCNDGSWTDWTEVLRFKISTKWYFTWWGILSIFAILATFAIFYLSHIFKLREEHTIREADEERIKFLVNVSHELRTPLTLVLGPLGRILKEMPQDNPNYEPLANVNRQALRMKSLLNTVLTAHKIEEGASSLNLASRDLSEWVEHVVSGFRDEARGREINIVTKFDKAASTLSFDDDKCQIVLSNILMNALKHSPSRSTITVSTEARQMDKMVRVAVADQGNGITIKDTSKLFERFYQESGNSKNGFGIGLSYCKTIIEQHHGTVGAFNNAEGGATFYYDLPATIASAVFNTDNNVDLNAAKESNASRMTKRIRSEFEEHKASKSLKEANVLLVDDNIDFREYIRNEVGHKVHNIIVAGNGKEALDLLQAEPVDIVLTDVMMPMMDGFELCRRIKAGEAGRNDIPVVLLTARSDENSRILGFQNGADGYLVKPFETETMLATVKSLLSKIDR